MNDPLDWQELNLFAAVARGGGLAPAARASGLSAPTLGRRMAALETAIGERLFERGARGYALTPAGEALLERTVAMSDAAAEIEAWRAGDAHRRRVRISAGGWTMQLLLEHLPRWWSPDDDWAPELVSELSKLDLGRREIDLGIRNRRPEESWLAGRSIGEVDYAVYRAAHLDDSVELGWVELIGTDERECARGWRAARYASGIAFTVSRHEMGLPIVRQGLGRMAMPRFVGDACADLTREGGAAVDAFAHRRWLVMHQDQRHLPHVRAAIEALATFFVDTVPTLS